MSSHRCAVRGEGDPAPSGQPVCRPAGRNVRRCAPGCEAALRLAGQHVDRADARDTVASGDLPARVEVPPFDVDPAMERAGAP